MKALEVSDVSISYNGNMAIDKVSFGVEEGDLLGIVGPNGAGKTTLFRAILSLQNYSGTIRLFGLEGKKYYPLLPLIGYVSQKVNFEQNFPATVSEVVGMGLLPDKVRDKSAALIQSTGYSWNQFFKKFQKFLAYFCRCHCFNVPDLSIFTFCFYRPTNCSSGSFCRTTNHLNLYSLSLSQVFSPLWSSVVLLRI